MPTFPRARPWLCRSNKQPTLETKRIHSAGKPTRSGTTGMAHPHAPLASRPHHASGSPTPRNIPNRHSRENGKPDVMAKDAAPPCASRTCSGCPGHPASATPDPHTACTFTRKMSLSRIRDIRTSAGLSARIGIPNSRKLRLVIWTVSCATQDRQMAIGELKEDAQGQP